jgi:hypothetical protein
VWSKLRNATKPSTLAQQIFLEKNRPFVEFAGDIGNSNSISTSDRNHSPLLFDLSPSILVRAEIITCCMLCFVESNMFQLIQPQINMILSARIRS